jgi:hypothetical protein
MSGFKSQPLGMLMEPDPGNPQEVEGVLNPAAARCPDGELYLFPRLVARGNYSRIGIARVGFNKVGEPVGVERRNPIPSLNLLLTSTCWRNDHNGFSHQSPGLIDTVLAVKGTVGRIYLPPDANCLLSVARRGHGGF